MSVLVLGGGCPLVNKFQQVPWSPGVTSRGQIPVQDGLRPDPCTEGVLYMKPYPSLLWTDKHNWKHYLPTTSLAGGNECVSILLGLDQRFWFHSLLLKEFKWNFGFLIKLSLIFTPCCFGEYVYCLNKTDTISCHACEWFWSWQFLLSHAITQQQN